VSVFTERVFLNDLSQFLPLAQQQTNYSIPLLHCKVINECNHCIPQVTGGLADSSTRGKLAPALYVWSWRPNIVQSCHLCYILVYLYRLCQITLSVLDVCYYRYFYTHYSTIFQVFVCYVELYVRPHLVIINFDVFSVVIAPAFITNWCAQEGRSLTSVHKEPALIPGDDTILLSNSKEQNSPWKLLKLK
jgi:hypothetical protein